MKFIAAILFLFTLSSCFLLQKTKTFQKSNVDSIASSRVDTASFHLFDSVSNRDIVTTNENTITVEFDSGFIVHEKINPSDYFNDSTKNVSFIDVLSRFSGTIKKVTIDTKIADTQKDIFHLKVFDSAGKITNEDVQVKKTEVIKTKKVEKSGLKWYVWVAGGIAFLLFLLLLLYKWFKKNFTVQL